MSFAAAATATSSATLPVVASDFGGGSNTRPSHINQATAAAATTTMSDSITSHQIDSSAQQQPQHINSGPNNNTTVDATTANTGGTGGGDNNNSINTNVRVDPNMRVDDRPSAAVAAATSMGTTTTTHAPNPNNIGTVTSPQTQPATPSSTSKNNEQQISYSAERIIGNGSFGVVFQAAVVETGEIVAIKKVLQDKRFKNRELQIMRQLVKDPHSNIVALKHCFYSQGEKPDELYLNLVLEYVPETVYSISRAHQKSKMTLPLIFVKLYLYQLSRALAHIHALGICHRDIKPQNLLVNPVNQQLKLCDFGSAKALVKGEPNVSYICSRYYRAPELIFGSTDYTTAIDIWSEGCVGAELLLGQPLFPGDSGVDQLVEIIKVLGTPTREEISSMNSNYIEFKFPQIKGCQWRKVFRNKTPDEAMDFISKTLAYTPEKRIKPLEGCTHPFFDELRNPNTRLPQGEPLPPVFDFTQHELNHPPEIVNKLVPPHAKAALEQAAAQSPSTNLDSEKKSSSTR